MDYSYKFERSGDYYEVSSESYEGAYPDTYKGYQVYHPYQPVEDVERIVGSISHNYHNNYVVFGIRNTRLIEVILSRMSAYSTLTCIEFDVDGADFHLIGTEHFSKVFTDPRVKFLYQRYDELITSVSTAFKQLRFDSNMKNTHVLVCPYMRSLYPKELMSAFTIIFERLYSQLAGYGNAVEDTLWGTDNLFNNWDVFCEGKPSHLFAEAFKGTPVVIVGAGPSLDKDIEAIRSLQGKALIFAVDAAVKKLRDSGIEIDAITTIERTEEPLIFYQTIDHFDKEVFLGPNVIVKEILQKFSRRMFSGRLGDGVFMSINKYIGNDNIDVGLTVANVLMAYATLLGCNPIILSGVDLAYLGGKTHTSELADSLPEDLQSAYRENVTKIMGVNGDMLDTYEYFAYTKVWLEKHINLHREARYINATRGGAFIIGAEHMHLEAVVQELHDAPVLSQRLYHCYDGTEHGADYPLRITGKALEFVEDLIEKVQDLKQAAIECQDEISKQKQGRVNRVIESRERVDDLYIASDAMRFLFQPIFMSYFRDMHGYPIFLNSEDEERFVNRALHYYKTIEEVSDKIVESYDVYGIVLREYRRILGGSDGN